MIWIDSSQMCWAIPKTWKWMCKWIWLICTSWFLATFSSVSYLKGVDTIACLTSAVGLSTVTHGACRRSSKTRSRIRSQVSQHNQIPRSKCGLWLHHCVQSPVLRQRHGHALAPMHKIGYVFPGDREIDGLALALKRSWRRRWSNWAVTLRWIVEGIAPAWNFNRIFSRNKPFLYWERVFQYRTENQKPPDDDDDDDVIVFIEEYQALPNLVCRVHYGSYHFTKKTLPFTSSRLIRWAITCHCCWASSRFLKLCLAFCPWNLHVDLAVARRCNDVHQSILTLIFGLAGAGYFIGKGFSKNWLLPKIHALLGSMTRSWKSMAAI